MIAAAIVGKQVAHVLACKANHGKLCRQVKRTSDTTEWLNYEDAAAMGKTVQGKGHGRSESHHCLALPVRELDSPHSRTGIQSMAMVESIRKSGDSCPRANLF